jgi:hypothetical protein
LLPESYERIDAEAKTNRACAITNTTKIQPASSSQEGYDTARLQREDPDIGPVYAAFKQSKEEPDWQSFICHSEDTMNLLA